MAPLLTPDSESNDSASKNFFPRLLKGAGITLGGTAIAGTAGAGWWGWNFIQSDLAPLVQKDLQRRIDRPLEIGDLESVSWGKVTFGKSSAYLGGSNEWAYFPAFVQSWLLNFFLFYVLVH